MKLAQTSSNNARSGPARAHRYWLALCVMLLGLACTGVVWRLIQKSEINRIQRITRLVGAAVSADASADSDGWLRELERFAQFASRGRLAKTEWQELALLYVQHHPGTLCMDRVAWCWPCAVPAVGPLDALATRFRCADRPRRGCGRRPRRLIPARSLSASLVSHERPALGLAARRADCGE